MPFLILALALWPQLLGPTRDGVYTGPWSPKSTFAKLWERRAGEGFSAPVVTSDGKLLLFHRDANQEKLEALDPATGKTLWTFAYPTSYRDDFGFSEGPRAAPASDATRAVVYGAEGMLHAVDLKSARKLWAVDARQEFGVRKEYFGAAVSPLLDGDRVLMNLGGANGAGLVAIDAATGRTLWKALTDEAGYASPTVATIGGQRHALFFTRTGLVDADPATGRIRFQFRWRSRSAASVNAATPLVLGNRVFLSASYGTGAALLELGDGPPKVIWSGDDSLSNHYATSVHRAGVLYGFHGRQETGQELRAVEAATGKVLWSENGLRAGTVTLAGDHLLVITEGGELIVAPASPKAFAPVKRTRLLAGVVRSYPALAAGRMYVRNETTLAAFRID